jgi:hypothetical protein
MSYPIESNAAPLANPAPASPVGLVGRTAALVGALFIVLVGAVFSLGAVILAPAAMGLAAYIWHKRGRDLSMVGYWIAALCGVALVAVSFAGALTAFVPKGTWQQVQRSADSASAHTPPPKWLDRIAPGAAERAAQQRAASSPTMQTVGLAYGMGFAAIFFVGIFGTIGWIAGMLFGLTITGHWPGATT